MSKNVNVIFPEENEMYRCPEIKINFLNGEVTIPGRSGGYVIASGCGSGKTTAIRQIILNEFHKGIIYSAATIRECNEMYKFLVDSGIDKGRMIVLHSETQDDGVDMNTFRSHPELLADKNIIICTHHKLLNEYPEVFMAYNRGILRKSRLSHLTRCYYKWDENGECRLPRQYVLIDEMPTCDSFNFRVDMATLRILGIPDTEIAYDEEGKPYTTARMPLNYTNGGNYELTERLYKESGLDLVNSSNTVSGKLKSDLALSIIYENYRLLTRSLEKRDPRDFKILRHTIADQISAMSDSSSNIRYLIFDGTGDLTFRNDNISYCPFQVLTYDNKYNSPIEISKIEIGYKRSYRCNRDFHNAWNSITSNIQIQIRNIYDIISSGHKVLIVTWKDFKVKGESRGIPLKEGFIDEMPYIDYIRYGLNSLGFIEGVNYSIIHYQSGLDKATNEFREYDSVYFLGEFHVPNTVVDQFNQDYRVNTDVLNYTLYQLVQAVCRTRIRNHRGERIWIHFTNDWSDEVINGLVNYLSYNSLSEVRDTTLNRIRPKWRPVVELFCSLDSEFKRAIETGCGYEFNIELDCLYDMIPASRKKSGEYTSIIRYLKKLGIDMNITSNIGRPKKDVNL